MRKLIAHSCAAILLAFASFIPVASADSDMIARTAGGIPYVSGGIGDESIERLNSLAGDFNLKLVLALNAGDYVSDVRVTIADAKGKTLLDTTSERPWFYTRLPAGNYQLAATLSGKTIKHRVTVGPAKLRTVDFRWATE